MWLLLAIAVLVVLGGSAQGDQGADGSVSSLASDLGVPSWSDLQSTFDSAIAEISTMSGGTITSDPSTWPTGDRIWNIAQAIAYAEGYNIPGSNPNRLNNPGDISDGAGTFSAEAHSGSMVTVFPDAQTGWTWLYNKLNNIALGVSHVYSADMTWIQLGQKWAGNWQNWVRNVTSYLGVDPNSTFRDYVEGV